MPAIKLVSPRLTIEHGVPLLMISVVADDLPFTDFKTVNDLHSTFDGGVDCVFGTINKLAECIGLQLHAKPAVILVDSRKASFFGLERAGDWLTFVFHGGMRFVYEINIAAYSWFATSFSQTFFRRWRTSRIFN